MSRGIGGVAGLQDLLPEWMALVAAVLTQLGDFWFLSLLLLTLYWRKPDENEDVLLVASLLVAAVGVYRTLKHVFQLPRPNEPLLAPEMVPALIRPLYEATALATSYGFPSGHATSSTVVYVGLATVLTIWSKRRRYVVAGSLVVVVGLTRVVLGLHYLVDIVAGIALGLSVVGLGFWGVDRVTDDRVSVTLFVALCMNVVYLLASSAAWESVVSLGGALAMFAGWQFLVRAQ